MAFSSMRLTFMASNFFMTCHRANSAVCVFRGHVQLTCSQIQRRSRAEDFSSMYGFECSVYFAKPLLLSQCTRKQGPIRRMITPAIPPPRGLGAGARFQFFLWNCVRRLGYLYL